MKKFIITLLTFALVFDPKIVWAKDALIHCGMDQKVQAAHEIEKKINQHFSQAHTKFKKLKSKRVLNKKTIHKLTTLSDSKLKKILNSSKKLENIPLNDFKKSLKSFYTHIVLGQPYKMDPNALDMRSYCHAACCSHKNFKCGKTHVQTKCHTKSYPKKCATYCHKRCKDHSKRTCGVKTHCGWYHHHHHRYYKCHTHKDCHDHHYRTCFPHCATHCHIPRSHECQFKLPGGAWQPCKLSPMKKWEIALLVVGAVVTIATLGSAAGIDAGIIGGEAAGEAAAATAEGEAAAEAEIGSDAWIEANAEAHAEAAAAAQAHAEELLGLEDFDDADLWHGVLNYFKDGSSILTA